MSASSNPSPTASAPRRRTLRINRSVGTGAGLLSVAILTYALVGGVWGLLRPAYEATPTADGQLALGSPGNVQFTSFMTFTLLTALLGLGVGIAAFLRSPETRGLAMLWWAGVVAVIAAVGFWAVGEFVAGIVHPLPDPAELVEGEVVRVSAALNPGLGLIAAPLLAMASYWVCVLLDVDGPDLRAEPLSGATAPR